MPEVHPDVVQNRLRDLANQSIAGFSASIYGLRVDVSDQRHSQISERDLFQNCCQTILRRCDPLPRCWSKCPASSHHRSTSP